MNNTNKIVSQINDILDDVRPGIQMDGGDVALKSFKDGIVILKIKGACVGCPMAQMTFEHGIGSLIRDKIKQVKQVKYE